MDNPPDCGVFVDCEYLWRSYMRMFHLVVRTRNPGKGTDSGSDIFSLQFCGHFRKCFSSALSNIHKSKVLSCLSIYAAHRSLISYGFIFSVIKQESFAKFWK
eukprot:TRINITY_DN6576_c0_g2_i3.p2 TRINITY_DN6576_c0_g2~~TRINITY_DN6576_c0_g2_i3.p2  ORF type:complete len:102 (+),score=1.25 TRINITY_DN6576_c0_g2_i3:512-817(+)